MSRPPAKASRPRSQTSGNRRNERHVVPVSGGWAVKTAASARTCGIYGTQAEAEKAAKEMVRIRGGEVLVQGRNGRWRDSFTLGRDGFAKISAVEGIRLSGEMQRDIREFDREALSDDERRRRIARRYGSKRT